MRAGAGPAVTAMSPTTAAGPPAAMGPAAAQSAALRSAVAPEPVPQGDGADPAALLQGQRSAECELAEALARFQSEVRPAAEMSLAAVVEAARGAFRLGFAYTSCRGLDDDGQPLLEVTVLHRGGDQLSSQVRLLPGDAEQEFREAARLLAQLLGIPVCSVAQQAQHSKAKAGEQGESSLAVPGDPADASVPAVTPPDAPDAGSCPEAAPPADPTPATTPAQGPAPAIADAAAPAPAPAAAPADTIGPGSPDAPCTEESLRPLGEEERDTLLEMIRSLRPVEARRQFQIAFRHHFNVPKQERTIAGFITQQRHKDFIDRFERELADLPAPTAPAETSEKTGEGADA
ncbi:MAG: hypothetical protein ACK5GZ_18080 [Cyanobium sp.]|jgi:hypothetical protein